MGCQEMGYDCDLNLKATELRLGLPGSEEQEKESTSSIEKGNKRASSEAKEGYGSSLDSLSVSGDGNEGSAPPSKAQIVGWPPIRSYRKNHLQPKKPDHENGSGMYVKVSMDGAPYLRKIDLKMYKSYVELEHALGNMFMVKIGRYSEREGYNGSDYAPTYEDKDGDWMLVGDVPWELFVSSCKRLRVMKSSEAKGLGCL